MTQVKLSFENTSELAWDRTRAICVVSEQARPQDPLMQTVCSQDGDSGARDDVVRWADGFLLVYSVTSRQTFEVREGESEGGREGGRER